MLADVSAVMIVAPSQMPLAYEQVTLHIYINLIMLSFTGFIVLT
jgi:hypothetical protein